MPRGGSIEVEWRNRKANLLRTYGYGLDYSDLPRVTVNPWRTWR